MVNGYTCNEQHPRATPLSIRSVNVASAFPYTAGIHSIVDEVCGAHLSLSLMRFMIKTTTTTPIRRAYGRLRHRCERKNTQRLTTRIKGGPIKLYVCKQRSRMREP